MIEMKFTGERMIPEYNEGKSIYVEHVARYLFASQFVKEKDVLDIACGSGYGAKIFSKKGAKKVFGIDISEESISYCKMKYHKDSGMDFLAGDVNKIPLGDDSVDIIVSFETIEHVDEKSQKEFLKEVKRVLRMGGNFIVSTPNTLVAPRGNPYHIKELEPKDFHALLRENFLNVNMFYQDDVESSYIFSKNQLIVQNKEGTKRLSDCLDVNNIGNLDAQKSLFLIAICSDKKKIVKEDVIGNLTISGIKPWILRQRYEGKIKKMEGIVKNRELIIKHMEASNFWKIRGLYMKLKKILKIKKN